MTTFFSIWDNSVDTKGSPWAQSIVKGIELYPNCTECGGFGRWPKGDLQVELATHKGTYWPDALGCGEFPLFIVSGRVLEAWADENIGTFPVHRVEIVPPLPKRLQDVEPPSYFWLDGRKLRGARLDFDAGGFVDVTFCPKCNRRMDDIAATHDRQHSMVCPFVFVAGTWNGAHLFTTDLSPAAFFCSNAVVEAATRHRHTNFRFIPVEEGGNPASKGLKYLPRQRAKTHRPKDD